MGQRVSLTVAIVYVEQRIEDEVQGVFTAALGW